MKTNDRLVWLGNKGTLPERVKRAADFYKFRHDQSPKYCYMHPSEYDGNLKEVAGCKLLLDVRVQPKHLILSVKEWTHG